MATNGLAGLLTASPRILQFLLDEEADHARLALQRLGRAERAGVLAVGRAEGVVDIDIAELGELFGEVRLVLFLFLVEADVFEQQHVAVLQRIGRLLGLGADAVAGELHRFAQKLAEPVGARLERILGLRPALGPAKVRHEDHPAAAIDDVLDRRQRHDDTPIVGDLAAFEGHVEIDAHEHALTFDIHIRNSLLSHKLSLGFRGAEMLRGRAAGIKSLGQAWPSVPLSVVRCSLSVVGSVVRWSVDRPPGS